MKVAFGNVALGPATRRSVTALSQPYPTVAANGLPGPELWTYHHAEVYSVRNVPTRSNSSDHQHIHSQAIRNLLMSVPWLKRRVECPTFEYITKARVTINFVLKPAKVLHDPNVCRV